MEKQRGKIAISFFLISSLISSTTAFQFKSGKCPEVEAMKDFDMNRFLGVWHVIQGTTTGSPVECVTFNLTKREDSNHLTFTQLPQNQSSELVMPNGTIPSKMSIHWSEDYEANFDVLVTDYDNFAGFFICKNNLDEKFQRAAAILSRTKILADHHRNLVKQHFLNYSVHDEDLTIVITCD